MTVNFNSIAAGGQIDLGIPLVPFLVSLGWAMRTRMIIGHVHCHRTRLKSQIEHGNKDKAQGAAYPGTVAYPSDVSDAQLIGSIRLFRRVIYTAVPPNNICGCYVAA